MSQKFNVIMTSLAVVFAAGVINLPNVAHASIPVPRVKPAPPPLSALLSPSDATLFRKGVRAAERGDWSTLKSTTASLNDPVAKDVLKWLRAARDPQAPMSVLTYVTHSLPDWPRMTAISAKTERKIFKESWTSKKTLDWFRGIDPVSGEGRAALAIAYYRTNDKTNGDKWLKLAWRESKLTRDGQQKIFGAYRSRLSKEDHAARADHLIWQGRSHFSKAQALLPHMGSTDRKVMQARMKIAQNGSGMNSAIKAVPTSAQVDPGFLFERAKWRRQKKSKNYALPMYLAINTAPTNADGQQRMWREKRIMVRWAISEGRHKDAYALSLHHGMTRGEGFAEAEFTAGWLALTKLRTLVPARKHFETLRDNVSSPISLSRAHYWLGRTAELERDGDPQSHYLQAAQYTNTYYGILAAAKVDPGAKISLPPEFVSDTAKARFGSDNRVRAARLLGETGNQRYFSQFAFHLDDEVEDIGELSLLSEMSKDFGFMRPSLRAAKQAGRFQSMLTDSGYPQVGSIDQLPSGFEHEFVYAIARQESEFATNATSSAKAYGMMQMINATAKATARKHRIPYSQPRLANDGDYAARMGALHLEDLLQMWEGSYILAAASYNAGPTRAKQWIRDYGDPRTGEVDPIDWVESVPFSETRNYIMRVMENMQMYRARLNNNSAPNQLEQDLRFGQQ